MHLKILSSELKIYSSPLLQTIMPVIGQSEYDADLDWNWDENWKMEILTFGIFVISATAEKKVGSTNGKDRKRSVKFTWDRISDWMLFSVAHSHSITHIFSHSTLFHCSFNSQKLLDFHRLDDTVIHRVSQWFRNGEMIRIHDNRKKRKEKDRVKRFVNLSISFHTHIDTLNCKFQWRCPKCKLLVMFHHFLHSSNQYLHGNMDDFSY